MSVTKSDRAAFHKGLAAWDEAEAEYLAPTYNAFGQHLRPHYCRHGIANLWSDYDEFCVYCEEGLSRSEYAMQQVRLARAANTRHAAQRGLDRLLADCARAPHDKLSATCGRIGYQRLVDIYQSLELKKIQKEI